MKKSITYSAFSHHSYDTLPLPTRYLSAAEVLDFRDKAFTKYHIHKPFLDKVDSKFGKIAVDNINEMIKIKLKRILFGDQPES